MVSKPSTRRKARSYAMQAVYQWQLSGNAIADIEAQFIETINPNKVDSRYFLELLRGTLTQLGEIDDILTPALARGLNEVDPVERAILRLAVFELKDRLDVPYKVVINEALELAKTFGATDGHKFVNGVLDKLVKELRTLELQTQNK